MNKNIKAHKTLLVCLVLILATLSVYWQVNNFKFINLDDSHYVYDNHHVLRGLSSESIFWAFSKIHCSLWIPFTWLSYMLDYELYGLNSGGYHLTNVIFHIINTLLLFFVLKKMTGAMWKSAFVAALFALHPLHVESVAWVTERKDVLSTFFWLLTIWSYIRFINNSSIIWYLWALAFFVCGFMTKPMLVTLPFTLLLLDYWPLGRFSNNKKVSVKNSKYQNNYIKIFIYLVKEKAVFFVISIIGSTFTFYVGKTTKAIQSFEILPLSTRIANAFVTYVSYIIKMAWPLKLSIFYPHPGLSLPLWQIIGSGLLILFMSVVIIRLIRKYPYLFFGWFWYLGTLVPVIGLVQAGSQSMADRFTYIPLTGIFIIFAWGFSEILSGNRFKIFIHSLLSGVILIACMIVSWFQVSHWENSYTIFEHSLNVTDNNYLAHINFAGELTFESKYYEAIKHLNQALAIKPTMTTYNAMGDNLSRLGKYNEAIEYYLIALNINPEYSEAYYNMGNAFNALGKTDEAIKCYSKALRNNSELYRAHNNLGGIYALRGDFEKAIYHYSEALRIKPDFVDSHKSLGNVLKYMGRIEEAEKHFRKAKSNNSN